jgi:hypothetical protein
LQAYRHGQGVDPLAGAEAVISHLVVRTFQVPCAHAPALMPLPLDPDLSPRSAAEELGYTFLPCVLVGLSRAPQFVVEAHPKFRTHLYLETSGQRMWMPCCTGNGLWWQCCAEFKPIAIADYCR